MDALAEVTSIESFEIDLMKVTLLAAFIESFVEVPKNSPKVTSMQGFVQDLVKDCKKNVSTESFVEITSKEAFVKVTSMKAFAKSFVELTFM